MGESPAEKGTSPLAEVSGLETLEGARDGRGVGGKMPPEIGGGMTGSGARFSTMTLSTRRSALRRAGEWFVCVYVCVAAGLMLA